MADTRMAPDASRVFGPILSSIQSAPDTLRMAAYVSALKRMDWQFEFSDDGRVYREGRNSLEVLRHEQRQVDPQGALWNQYAPDIYKVKVAEFTPATDAQPWRVPL